LSNSRTTVDHTRRFGDPELVRGALAPWERVGVLRAGGAWQGRRGAGGSSGNHADAVALADLVLLAVGGGLKDVGDPLVERRRLQAWIACRAAPGGTT
jgi:hypothetical protein